MNDNPITNFKPWLMSESDPLSEQSEAFISRQIYMAHDLIGKLNYVSSVLKGMYVTEPIAELFSLLEGENSAVSVLANKHLLIIQDALKSKKDNEII